MSLSNTGKNILEVEIQSISGFEVWLLVHGKEYFMSYDKFPWFKNDKVGEILAIAERILIDRASTF